MLTSAPGAGDLPADFKKFKLRIRYHFGCWEYIAIRTNEGNGVYHILYRGPYIPHAWASRNWAECHGGSICVWIRDVSGSPKQITRYLIAQYLAGQSAIQRVSWSWGWVYRGFVSIWKWLVREFGLQAALRGWNAHLSLKYLVWTRVVAGDLEYWGLDPPCDPKNRPRIRLIQNPLELICSTNWEPIA